MDCDSIHRYDLVVSPETAFLAFQAEPHTVWLDSCGPLTPRSRYSYLAIWPFEMLSHDIFAALDGALHRFARPAQPGLPPFTGGAVGFLGYELGASLNIAPRHPGLPGIPDFCVGLYDLVLVFDRLASRAWLFSSGLPETEPSRRAARAAARAAGVLARLHAGPSHHAAPVCLRWAAETQRAVHEARVARAIAYIHAGDIYQANITMAFSAARPPGLAAADIHLALRAASPAPFSAFLGLEGGCAIASASPERFLSVDADGRIEARPIKGTRPRGADPLTDAALLAELLASPKDHAENLMIVDLLRHDIARVAEIGSVHVPELAVAESFANVHHLVSIVRGRLRADATAIDLLRAAFPGGSITGAPKRRAQQIIHALEPTARGPYCGSVLWLGWDGSMDSSIAIRTVTVGPELITVQAGGGVVADSDPGGEYEELLVKVLPLLGAVGRKEAVLF